MPSYRDTQPVQVIKKDAIDRASPSIGQDHAPADQFLLGGVKLAEDFQGSLAAAVRTLHANKNGRAGQRVPARCAQEAASKCKLFDRTFEDLCWIVQGPLIGRDQFLLFGSAVLLSVVLGCEHALRGGAVMKGQGSR